MSTSYAWTPSKKDIEASHIYALMQEQGIQTFDAIQAWSVKNPEAFWQRTVKKLGVILSTPYRQVLDIAKDVTHAQWLVGAKLNIAQTCLGRTPEKICMITRRLNGKTDRMTFLELDRLSNRVANGLTTLGIQKGDSVAIDMAMTAESIAIYFGVIKIGGMVVSIPDSFPPEEIAKRLRIGKAKAVFTQDVLPRGDKMLPMYEKVCAAHAPVTVMLPTHGADITLRAGDKSWEDFLSSNDQFDTIACDPHDPMTILFSSGTTGEPKAIPWDHTTAIKCASDAMYHHDIKPGDIACWPTSLGWMMGPWLIFASFINGAAIALYDGGPVERGFCEFVQDAKVTMLGLVPSIVKGWRKTGCAEGLDWSAIKAFSSSGEASNANDYRWLMELNQPKGILKPVVEYCGGTEVGGAYVASNVVTPQNPSEFNGKVMGIDFIVLDEQNKPTPTGEMGEVFLIPPSIGLSTRLLNADNDAVYYKDTPSWNGKILRRHGDRLMVIDAEHFQSDGRSDNTMNLGGIKVSSAEIERTVSGVKGVIETAAVGVPPKEGGPDRLVIYTVADPAAKKEELKVQMQKAIKESLNPLFHVHEVIVIDALPRTASNKVLHKDLRKKYRESEA